MEHWESVSAGGYLRSAKVKLHSGRVIGRPLKLLFPVEVSARDREQNDIERNTFFHRYKIGAPYTKQQSEQEKKKRFYVTNVGDQALRKMFSVTLLKYDLIFCTVILYMYSIFSFK